MSQRSAAVPGPVVETGPGRLLLRTAYLMLGAAIFVAFLLLMISIGQLLVTRWAAPLGVVVPVLVVPLFLLGLLPGLREVETTAARSLLGVTAELVVPEHPRAEHRVRTAAWVGLHLVVGGLVGLGIVFGVAWAGSSLWQVAATGSVPGELQRLVPGGLPGRLVGLAAGLAVLGLVAVGTWLAGVALARWAPRFLGPTWRDRLELAQLRLRAETEHRRLARDLHDGVGHALSIISLQAVAGRRVIDSDLPTTREALETIEATARTALEGLDDMLGVLRDEAAAPLHPEPGLSELGQLVEAHRRVGMQLDATIDPALAQRSPALAPLLCTTLYRIVSEGLTNAARYAGSVPVRLVVMLSKEDVVVELRNPVSGRTGHRGRPGRGPGHGLDGISERVALFGGQLTAGVDGGDWLLRATLPAGRVDG